MRAGQTHRSHESATARLRLPRRIISSFAVVAALVLAAPTLATPWSHAATASVVSTTDLESRFVTLVNQLRVGRGLRVLQEDGDLRRIAATWTDRMVVDGRLSHNRSLADQSRLPWAKLGENVGRGGDVDSIELAFEASPGHLRNLVDPDFDAIAVVVRRAGDRIYVTQQFRATLKSTDLGAPDVLAANTPRH